MHKDATLIKQEQQSQVYKDTFLKMSKIKWGQKLSQAIQS